MKALLGRFTPFFRPFFWPLTVVFLLLVAAQTTTLAGPYFYGRIIDGIVKNLGKAPGVIITAILPLLLINFAISLVESTLNYLRERYEIKKLDFALVNHLTFLSVGKFLGFSIGQHTNQHSGIKKSIIDKGEMAMHQLMNTVIYSYLPTVLQAILALIFLAFISWPLTLAVLAMSGVYIWLMIANNLHFNPRIKALQTRWHDNTKTHSEITRHPDIIQLNAREDQTVDEYMDDRNNISLDSVKTWTSFINHIYLTMNVIDISKFIILGAAVVCVAYGYYSLGQLAMILSWSSTVLGRLYQIGSTHRQSIKNWAEIKKYLELLEIEPEVKNIDNPLRPGSIAGDIVFDQVSFTYPKRLTADNDDDNEPINENEEREVLTNVSFTIKAGEKVAIVGKSGDGKSTIAQLLLRAFDPQAGRITLDGHDLRTLDFRHYRQKIGYVEQDVTVFDRSLRDNICYGMHQSDLPISQEKMDAVLETTQLTDFINKLDKGLDTYIGERGIKLSGGERQRVAIARAIIKDPNLLLFDEATSALDAINEKLVRQAIDRVSQGRTTIIIAHRLSTIKNVDKVIVMDNGQIADYGSYAELSQSSEIFRDLIAAQTTDPVLL
ncbi:MAG: ABC transporter ATP-binding protein [Candidatus Falkowbacteria bacterium]